jgi:hypothetical protein
MALKFLYNLFPPCQLCDFYNTVSGEIFGHNQSNSWCFQVQPVTCLWSFSFSLSIWDIFYRFLLKWWAMFLKSWTSTGSPVTRNRFSQFIATIFTKVFLFLFQDKWTLQGKLHDTTTRQVKSPRLTQNLHCYSGENRLALTRTHTRSPLSNLKIVLTN